MKRVFLLLCCLLVLAATHLPAQQAGADRLEADLRALRANGVETDTPSLAAFLRRAVVPAETKTRVEGLIARLGSDQFDEREKASAELKEIGRAARLQLRAAARSADAEVRLRAGALLEALPPPWAESALLPTAAHVLACRNAPGTTELLLACLPHIEGEDAIDETAGLLDAVAFAPGGEPAPALLKALRDAEPARRWAAACALIRHAPAHRKAAQELLQDGDEEVRLRVAVALVRARDRAGLPVLLRLLASKSPRVAEEAEEVLARVAGGKGPRREVGVPTEKRREAWEAWEREAAAGIDLGKLDLNTPPGGTLIGLFRYANRHPGLVLELDAEGRVLWEFVGIEYPIYARKVGRDRVLVCEFMGRRVTERDTAGRILREWKLDDDPYCVQRLATGNTFIATRNRLLEYSRTGKLLTSIERPDDIVAAAMDEDGTFTVVTSRSTCVRLDREGRQTASFPIGAVFRCNGFKAHILPDGGVVIPEEKTGWIREYDRAGKLVAEVQVARVRVEGPLAVTKLPNGNYLYTFDDRTDLIEVTPQGKRVSARPVPKENNGERMRILFAEPR